MKESIRIIFPVSMQAVKMADDIFEAVAQNASDDGHIISAIRTVLSEAFSNAFLYGDKRSDDAVIEFKVCFSDNKFIASIINEGQGFADKNIKWDEFPPVMDESGRGIQLIRKLSDKAEFRCLADHKFEVYIEIFTGTKDKVKNN